MSISNQLIGTVKAYIHEGGPRPTVSTVTSIGGSGYNLAEVSLTVGKPAPPELLNVDILELNGRAYTARLLDQPRKLACLKPGDFVTLYHLRNAHPPFLVSDAYVRQRKGWIISPCSECGFSELFDAPQEIIGAQLKLTEESHVKKFTWACPIPDCDGTILIDQSVSATQSSGSRPQKLYWWLREELNEPWGKAILGGLALLIFGCVFSWWSYVNRDPDTGGFYIMPKPIVIGAVMLVSGFVYRHFVRKM